MNKEKLNNLQNLWNKADIKIKQRAIKIYGINQIEFENIVNGVNDSEVCILQAIQAIKQAFKDNIENN